MGGGLMPPVTPYTEPTIAPNIAQPWPQQAEERLTVLERIVNELSVMHGSLMEHLDIAQHNERFYTQDERIDALVNRVASLEEFTFTALAIHGMISVEDEDDADF